MSNRINIASLTLAASALVNIAIHEGFTAKAIAPVPGDVATYGFGTTTHKDGTPVTFGETITPTRALVRLLEDSDKFQQAVKRCVGDIPLTNNEFSAYVSLTYNIGSGAFCKSSIPIKLKKFDYEGACKTILLYDNFKGKPLPGLTRRRKEEYELCIS